MTATDLTEKQYFTLRALLAGKSASTIAHEHGVSHNAVYVRLISLRKKLGLNNDAQLGAWAERHGIREET